MAPRGSGVILHPSGSPRATAPGMANTGPTDAAMEAMYRYLAAELGPRGIRIAGIHTAGVRETLTAEKIATVSGGAAPDVEAIIELIAAQTMLRRAPGPQQIADTACFLASDRAGAITSEIVNATRGLVAG
jgi:enoyl-[acyl-carrier-protein] reductase (NADH)